MDTGLFSFGHSLTIIDLFGFLLSVRKIYGNEVRTRMRDAAEKVEQQKIYELDLKMYFFFIFFFLKLYCRVFL